MTVPGYPRLSRLSIAQTAQVLDFLHRSGNVHDSHGAREFILACIQAVRKALPGIIVEVRMDSAFFSDEIVSALQADGVEFFAHNLTRELQMATTPPSRNTTTNRAALWAFEKLDTLRTTILHRAGRFTRPQGILTLTLNANTWARQHFLALLHALKAATPAA